MTEPPNFSGTYPLGGELIGPAWREAWARLAAASSTPRPWLTSTDLAEAMCAAVPIQDKTARNLLQAARRAGVLEVDTRRGKRNAARYRIAVSA